MKRQKVKQPHLPLRLVMGFFPIPDHLQKTFWCAIKGIMMKKFIVILLIGLHCSHPLMAKEYMSDYGKNSDALYRQGAGAEDGAFSAIGLSMFGWGIGLAAGIAILAGVLHQSKSSGAHDSSSSSHCH
ncbi:MAG: hypothetical protein ACHQT8_06180 [Chlamydiales bacterium]